jgi:hypothetical protein
MTGGYPARYVPLKERRSPFDRRKILMHRVITNAPEGVLVDHIDGNTLNNQRSNLRLCTNQQNGMNRKPRQNGSSRYKGVTWNPSNRCWVAQIKAAGNIQYLGSFKDERDAAREYNNAARQHFGEFARLNVIEE